MPLFPNPSFIFTDMTDLCLFLVSTTLESRWGSFNAMLALRGERGKYFYTLNTKIVKG